MRVLMNRRAPISGFDSPSRGQPRNLGLLGGQLDGVLDGAPTGGLACGPQLAPGPLGERSDAHCVQHLVSGALLLPGLAATALAAQPLAVEQVRAGQVRADPGPAQPLDRLPVTALGRIAVAEQSAGRGLRFQAPIRSGSRARVRTATPGRPRPAPRHRSWPPPRPVPGSVPRSACSRGWRPGGGDLLLPGWLRPGCVQRRVADQRGHRPAGDLRGLRPSLPSWACCPCWPRTTSHRQPGTIPGRHVRGRFPTPPYEPKKRRPDRAVFVWAERTVVLGPRTSSGRTAPRSPAGSRLSACFGPQLPPAGGVHVDRRWGPRRSARTPARPAALAGALR